MRYAVVRQFAKLGFDFCSGPLYYSETVTEGQFGQVLTYAWLAIHKGQVGNEKKKFVPLSAINIEIQYIILRSQVHKTSFSLLTGTDGRWC